MKKISLIIVLLTVVMFSQAQSKNSTQVSINGTHIAPTTAIVVELVVKREVIKNGPYSRYATELLGVVAPLNDKTTCTIEAVRMSGDKIGTISSVALKNGKQKQGFNKGNQVVNNQFTDVSLAPIYSETQGAKSTRTMAADAANTIFKIRSRRFDLVTGENSENVFGAGLSAAIDEMSRIEKEYTELFLGKHTIEYLIYQYEIIPESGKENYMICRFDATSGIIDGLNINGTPVVLTTIDENRIENAASTQSKKGASVSTNRVQIADIVLCKVTLGEELLAEKRIPILQFGDIGEILQPSNDSKK